MNESDIKELIKSKDLVAISFPKQVKFYLVNGVQPTYVLPKKNGKPNTFTYWFERQDHQRLYPLWELTKPKGE